jgi:hypothetical protein
LGDTGSGAARVTVGVGCGGGVGVVGELLLLQALPSAITVTTAHRVLPDASFDLTLKIPPQALRAAAANSPVDFKRENEPVVDLLLDNPPAPL